MLKKDQQIGKLTRDIKVQLQDRQIGRVQSMVAKE